jgi:ADP-ribose pyrophosphatase YjhB (NUDIX family)
MPKIDIRIAACIIKDNKLLMVRHRKKDKKYWLLPGGRIEYGETLVEALKREILEETGFEVEVGNFMFISEAIPEDVHRHILNIFFEAHIVKGTLKIGNDDILDAVEFIDIDKLDDLVIYPIIKEELKLYIRERKSLGYIGCRWNN